MKYRLKKDLPFAKAGEEVYLKPEDLLYKRIALFDRTTYPYCLIVNDKIDFWIEGIKPREWWVNLYDVGEGGIFRTKETADKVASLGRKEIIKVIEVLKS